MFAVSSGNISQDGFVSTLGETMLLFWLLSATFEDTGSAERLVGRVASHCAQKLLPRATGAPQFEQKRAAETDGLDSTLGVGLWVEGGGSGTADSTL
jgi:hypothetical protein